MNTFGTATQQFPLVDARAVRANRKRFRRDALPALGRANSFYCPVGRWASRGWILLERYYYDQLSTYGTSFQLTVGDARDPDNTRALTNLSIVQAQCVTRGLATDVGAVYLVELTDDRGILHNEWFQSPTVSMYNIRAPAYPQTFHPASMNSGVSVRTTWTWETMLADLWAQMNTLGGGNVLGPWPGLPSAPAGTPEGFWFTGVPAWYALNDVLEHLGFTVTCDLTQGNPFDIVAAGAQDAAFNALQAKYGSVTSPSYRLEDDLEWIDTGAARVPGIVEVLFRRRNQVYGTEETTPYRNDAMAQQWDMASVYSVTVAAPAIFGSAVGTHHIWSDFTVRYDQDGNPLAADVATAAQIAAERVTQYFGKVYRQTAGYMTQVYAGALPFTTGSMVDGVCWYQDYSSQDRQGWKTKIVRGDSPPFDGLW